jgi:TatD DNase family protein
VLIDTHCHLEMMVQNSYQEKTPYKKLTLEQYQTLQNVVNQAEKNFVRTLITIGTTYERSIQGIDIAKQFEHVFAVIGIHPCDITDSWKQDLQTLSVLATEKEYYKIVGIGETGLDFYHPGFNSEQQKQVFHAHIELALKHDLALIVHTRNAIDETLQIIQQYKGTPLRGIIHCFSETLDIARDIQNMGFMMGIAAIITYPKNESLRDVVKTLELNNMVLETDSPFLPPQALRGKQNNPSHVRTIAEYVAHEVLGWSFEKVAETTSFNATKVFRI